MSHAQSAGATPAFEVVLVSYRSRGHVEELIGSWPADLPVVVVDNSANSDGIREMVAEHPCARYADGGGQGFARAANLGAASSSAPYVVFVNPDCRPAYDDLAALVVGLAADAGAASHAATMTGHDGNPEIGVGGWEPSVSRAVVHGFGLHKIFKHRGIFAQPALGEDCGTEWTTGACMAVPMGVFRRLGGFDEMFYVYAEDMSYGRRARQQGYHQVLRPDVLVRHGAGNSGAPSLEMLRLRGASFANYMRTYHQPVTRVGVIGATCAGYALRAAVAAKSHPDLSAQYRAFIAGMVTRRATVGGVEVADARYRETTAIR